MLAHDYTAKGNAFRTFFAFRGWLRTMYASIDRSASRTCFTTSSSKFVSSVRKQDPSMAVSSAFVCAPRILPVQRLKSVDNRGPQVQPTRTSKTKRRLQLLEGDLGHQDVLQESQPLSSCGCWLPNTVVLGHHLQHVRCFVVFSCLLPCTQLGLEFGFLLLIELVRVNFVQIFSVWTSQVPTFNRLRQLLELCLLGVFFRFLVLRFCPLACFPSSSLLSLQFLDATQLGFSNLWNPMSLLHLR